MNALHGPAGLALWLVASFVAGLCGALVLRRRAASDAAPITAAALVLLAALGDLAAPAPAGGFAVWLGAIPSVIPVFPSDVAWITAVTSVLIAPAIAAFVPRSGPGGAPPAMPWLPLVTAVVGAVWQWRGLGQQGTPVVLIGAIAALPSALATLSFAAMLRPTPTKPAMPPADAPPADVQTPAEDPIPVWTRLGALPTPAAPWLVTPGAQGQGRPSPGWAIAGGLGAPPPELDAVLQVERGALALLLDLPAATLAVVHRAVIRRAVLTLGERVLVITRPGQPATLDLDAALPAGLEPTVLTVGLEPLRRALAAGTPPAVAVMSADELGNGGASLLFPSQDAGRSAWARSLGWVLLPDVDRGDPLTLTHRLHTLRRLHLALEASAILPALLASGASGGAALRLLQGAFARRPVRTWTLTPADRPDVAVWLADWRFVAAGPDPWIVRLGRVTPAPFHVSDPLGLVPAGALAGTGGSSDGAVALSGRVSFAWLDAAGIAAHVLSAPQLACTTGRRHDTLWALHDDPVTRMLQGEGNLAALVQRGRLQPPQAVWGPHNRGIARDHLRRAIADGPQRVTSLRAAFGPSLVDEVVGANPKAELHFAGRDLDGTVQRCPQLPIGAPLERPVETRAATDRVVEIVEAASGRRLLVVDEINATTRFYPRRIFRVGPDRFEVPLHAHDQRRARVEVTPVDRSLDATIPMLDVTLTAKEALVAPETVRRGPVTFRLGTFDALVEEVVRGVRRGRTAEVEYPEVRSRYRTRVRLVAFDRMASRAAMAHLGASLRQVMGAQLALDSEDVLVRAVSPGWWPEWPGGLALADRHVQGAGLAEALDEHRVASLLDWVYAILHRCPCERGCARCSPAEVLETGDLDKAGVIALLGG